jgi:flagellar hook-length control protein FliK
MQNLNVSSQLIAPQKAAKAANASAASDATAAAGTTDQSTPESPADTFGRILAQQMTATKPGKAEEVIAALKDQSKKGDAVSEEDPTAAALAQVLYIDPNALPVQKFQASNASENAQENSALTRGVPSAMSAIAGKDLPVQDGKTADIAALPQSPDKSDAGEQSATELLAKSFDSVLASKQGDVKPDAPPATSNPAVSGLQAPVVTQQVAQVSSDQKPLTVPQQVGASEWGTGLGDKVVWMVGNQTRGAEIHLNPPALGPLEVRVSISDGQANLSFMTHHAAVREAIEAATPRLREMLGDNGIGMGSVSVDIGSFAQQQSQQQQAENGNRSSADPTTWFSLAGEDGASVQTFTSFVQPSRGRGAVDYFA